jgi:endonuclease G
MIKITILFLILSFNVFSQVKVDTIIKTKILESHFSYQYRNPIFVKYKLYKGGGDCNRSQFHFKTGKIKNSATSEDYSHSGYDIGHLAPAEDFAYDCKLDSLTFFFYNAVPQTPNLNRGVWKTYEEKIRDLSQRDSLLVICGGVYDSNYQTLKNGNVVIPKYCWKIVKSLSTGKIIYILWFTNEMEIHNSVQTELTIKELEKKIGFTLNLK